MADSRKPLYIKAREYLLDRISGMKPGENKLEPEHQLSDKLKMSRETVRKAMTTLIQEGIVSRWQGKGNYGHPEVTNLPMRMDINSDFQRLLNRAGYRVGTERSKPVVSTPSAEMLKRVPEASGTETVRYDLAFYADGKLAIQCRAELMKDNIRKMPQAGTDVENVSDFLKTHCLKEAKYTVAWLNAGLNEDVSHKFGLEHGTPLLEWEEVYYDIYDYKLGYVTIYFHPHIVDLSLLLHF